jgi:hypothetical protein
MDDRTTNAGGDDWGVSDAVEMDCMRCRKRALMRFYGMCQACRDELHAKFDGQGRTIEVPEYEPKPNVTPNAVALKPD